MRLQSAVLAGLLVLLLSCGPAIDRPVRGAVPRTEAPPQSTSAGVPPTLAPSFRPLPSPSPAVQAGPSAVASPTVVAAPPIVRTIAPVANAHVPVGGAVTVSAVLVGRGADLASASLTINGADTGAQI